MSKFTKYEMCAKMISIFTLLLISEKVYEQILLQFTLLFPIT